MKKIREGTLHIAGHDNHLYGLCHDCMNVTHLAVLGPEYDICFDEDLDEYYQLKEGEIEPNKRMANDSYERMCWEEAYHFELIAGKPYFGLLNIPMYECHCEKE